MIHTLTAILLIASASCCIVQEQKSGSIAITVDDQAGARIPHATLQANSIASGQEFHSTANAAGEMTIDLPDGSYDLAVSAPAFSRWHAKAEVKDGIRLDLIAVLRISPVSGPPIIIPLDDPGMRVEPPPIGLTIPEEPVALLVALPAHDSRGHHGKRHF